jgi:hypothetical protein
MSRRGRCKHKNLLPQPGVERRVFGCPFRIVVAILTDLLRLLLYLVHKYIRIIFFSLIPSIQSDRFPTKITYAFLVFLKRTVTLNASSDCGRRQPQDMEGDCKYITSAIAD